MASQPTNTTHCTVAHRLLVASPFVGGTPYARSVVFILGHSRQGAMGIILDEALRKGISGIQGEFANGSRFRQAEASDGTSLTVRGAFWGPGCLDAELQRGIWLTSPAELDEVFSEHDDLWIDLLRQIGQSVLREGLQITQFATAPGVN